MFDRSHFVAALNRLKLSGALVALMLTGELRAQYYWTNFAGEPGGRGNVDGTGSAARFDSTEGVAVDSAGNVYVADHYSNTIRKITPAGVVTTLAGLAENYGSTDGTGSAARFARPTGVAVDGNGNVYVSQSAQPKIRKITPAGVVTTLAGSGIDGSVDGTGAAARFNNPQGLAVDSAGNVYVADGGNYTIRKITPAGVVTTLAGLSGTQGSVDGTGSAARFTYPTDVAVDSGGNLYVGDSAAYTVRKVTAAGVVSTLAGSAGSSGSVDGTGAAARFGSASGVAVDGSGNVYVADGTNSNVRKITPLGVVSTWLGTAGVYGSADGTGAAAQFYVPVSVAVDAGGNVYVADLYNFTIRKASSAQVVTTLAGKAPVFGATDGTGNAARFNRPSDAALDTSGNLYVADTVNHTIRKVTPAGVTTTLAGSAGVSGYVDGTGGAARFYTPLGIATDGGGNVYVVDSQNERIRKITAAGVVTTVAGSGAQGSANGTGTAASFFDPTGIAIDGSGNLYVADTRNHTIRKITSAGVVTTLAGSAGLFGTADGTGSAARFNTPRDITIDSAGNLLVTENDRVRKVTPAGVVTVFAGGSSTGSVDGTGTAARFYTPSGIAADGSGNAYVCDASSWTIRKITSGAVVTTIGGTAGVRGDMAGIGAAAAFSTVKGLACTAAGTLFVVDYENNRVAVGSPGPVVTTGNATVVTTTTATLNGVANPMSFASTARFEYGPTTAYESTAAVTLSPASGTAPQNVTTNITGLAHGTLYHCRLAVTHAGGTVYGADVPFTTTGIPDISVEQPAGTVLASGATQAFAETLVSNGVNLQFTLKNVGTGNLTGLGITVDGPHAAMFAVTGAPVAPVAGPNGSTTFTVRFTPSSAGAKTAALHIASNDADENPFNINLTGTGLNNTPVISDIADAVIDEDTAAGPVAFTISDVETAAASLQLTSNSSNTALVPLSGIVFGGSGSSRTVTVTPATNQSGTATITLTVSDGVASASDTFLLTVNEVSDAPVISGTVAAQTVNDNATRAPFSSVTIADADSPAQTLTVSVTLDDAAKGSFTTLSGFTNEGGGVYTCIAVASAATTAIRGLVFTPAANRVAPGSTETTTLAISVSDGIEPTVTDAMTSVVATSINDAPTISAIFDVHTVEGTATPAISFAVGDADLNQTAALIVSAVSTNATLVPNASIVSGGSGTARTVTITPALGQTGLATITVTVSDGVMSADEAFDLRVVSSSASTALVNDPFTDGSRSGGADAGGAVWYQSTTATGAVTVVDDTAGIGGGNAMQLVPTSDFHKMLAFFPTTTLGKTGDTLRVTFDYRYLSPPSSLGDGFRVGLCNSNSTRQSSDTGGSTRFDDKNYGFNTNPGLVSSTGTGVKLEGAGDDVLGGGGGGARSGFGTAGTSVNSGITKHTAALTIVRLANGDLSIQSQIDSLAAASGTQPAAAVLTYAFDEFVFGFGGTGYRPTIVLDNVLVEATLTGTLPPPEIAVEQPVGTNLIDGSANTVFGSTSVGASSAALSFTIKNTGNGPLTGLDVTKDGANAGDFNVSTAGMNTTLAPAGSSTFTVTFTPAAAGSRTAALHIGSNDSDENPFDITLTGTAVAAVPEIAVEQPAGNDLTDGSAIIDFGGLPVNGEVTRVFTVRNVGTANLAGVAVTILGGNAANFTRTVDPAPTVAPGGSTTFSIKFIPNAVTSFSATMRIASNDANENPFDIFLLGEGLTPTQAWLQSYFGATGGTGDAAPTADPNKNGIPNLIEYALGGDPVSAGAGTDILPDAAINPTAHCVEFSLTRYLDRTDITLTVQAADSLAGPWTNLARSVDGAPFTVLAPGAVVTESGSGATRAVTVCDIYQVTDPAHSHRFMKLEVIGQ